MTQIKNDITGKAMIIEDEEDLSYLLAGILRKQNIAASCVSTLSEAKAYIKKINPDILFLDNHLPDGLGSDFIGEFREILPAAKIIMMTAQDSKPEVEKALHNGADYFISKPFSISTIQSILHIFKLANAG